MNGAMKIHHELPTRPGFYWRRQDAASVWRMIEARALVDDVDHLSFYDVETHSFGGLSRRAWLERFQAGEWVPVERPEQHDTTEVKAAAKDLYAEFRQSVTEAVRGFEAIQSGKVKYRLTKPVTADAPPGLLSRWLNRLKGALAARTAPKQASPQAPVS